MTRRPKKLAYSPGQCVLTELFDLQAEESGRPKRRVKRAPTKKPKCVTGIHNQRFCFTKSFIWHLILTNGFLIVHHITLDM